MALSVESKAYLQDMYKHGLYHGGVCAHVIYQKNVGFGFPRSEAKGSKQVGY